MDADRTVLAAVVGVCDEIEVVGRCLDHLKLQGVDSIVVVDMMSKDGTRELLRQRQDAGRIELIERDNDCERDADYLLAGVERARRLWNPEWLLVQDADEFCLAASGSLPEAVARRSHGVVNIPRYNACLTPHLVSTFAASGLVDVGALNVWAAPKHLSPEAMSKNPAMRWSAAQDVPKVVVATDLVVSIGPGGHWIHDEDGATRLATAATDMLIVHVPFLSYSRFARKMARVKDLVARDKTYFRGEIGWHWRHWLEVFNAGTLEEEFDRQFLDGSELESASSSGAVRRAEELLHERARADELSRHPTSSSPEPEVRFKPPGDLLQTARGDWQATTHREKMLTLGADPSAGTGLEIGALHHPIIPQGCHRVRFADYADTPTLRARHAGHPDSVAGMVDVDYVWSGSGSLAEIVGGRNLFDFVIASHVIQHMPNLLGWFRSIADVLKEGAVLNLACPDKRFTFDVACPDSTVGQLVEADLHNYTKPSIRQMFDHCYYAKAIEPGQMWADDIDIDATPAYSGEIAPLLALQQAHDILEKGAYIDSHCWFFTPMSFLDIVEGAVLTSDFPLNLEALTSTAPGGVEFYATFRKPEPRPPADLRHLQLRALKTMKQSCLDEKRWSKLMAR